MARPSSINMSRYNFLTNLLAFEAGNGPVVSAYLDTQVNENGKRTFDVVLRKQISEHLDSLPEDSDERRQFELEVEKVNEFATGLDPSVRGAAIFSCSGVGLFKTYEFQVPF